MSCAAGVPDGVTVAGSGRAVGTPDVARAVLACEVRAAAVATAVDGAAAALDRVRAAVAAGGVAAADLASGEAVVSVDHDMRGRPSGYVARFGLVATLRDLRGAGRLLSEALSAGGDASRLDGLELAVDDPQPLLQQARDRAYADALGKAQRYAALAGRSLGPLLGVADRPAPGVPVAVGRYVAAAEVGEVPLQPGSATVWASVEVRWQLA